MVTPKPDSRSLSHHFQVSTTLANLQPSNNYIIDLSIGHPHVAEAQDPIYDPKYTVRLADSLLGYGAICGFAYSPCPLTGLNNSTYTTLSMQFQADDPTETLTVYLSWYNGNFDVPLYLDSVIVRPSDNDMSSNDISEDVIPRSIWPSNPAENDSLMPASAVETGVPNILGLTCPTPESCPDGPPPTDITQHALRNSGFDEDTEGWDFFATAGDFEITRTRQSLEGDFAL